MPVRVLLVDDHAPTRGALRQLLAADPDVRVAGEAASGEESVRLAELLRPDVIVMDVLMPGIGGLEATRQIRDAFPAIRVIALSLHTQGGVRESMRRAGALAFVAKEDAFEQLPAAIRLAAGV